MRLPRALGYVRGLLPVVGVLLFGLAPREAPAESHASVPFERLSLEQGLSQSHVNCILQDRHGFLWLGTQDGLNRYDGYRFQVFKHDSRDPGSASRTTRSGRSSKTRTACSGWGPTGEVSIGWDRATAKAFAHHERSRTTRPWVETACAPSWRRRTVRCGWARMGPGSAASIGRAGSSPAIARPVPADPKPQQRPRALPHGGPRRRALDRHGRGRPRPSRPPVNFTNFRNDPSDPRASATTACATSTRTGGRDLGRDLPGGPQPVRRRPRFTRFRKGPAAGQPRENRFARSCRTGRRALGRHGRRARPVATRRAAVRPLPPRRGRPTDAQQRPHHVALPGPRGRPLGGYARRRPQQVEHRDRRVRPVPRRSRGPLDTHEQQRVLPFRPGHRRALRRDLCGSQPPGPAHGHLHELPTRPKEPGKPLRQPCDVPLPRPCRQALGRHLRGGAEPPRRKDRLLQALPLRAEQRDLCTARRSRRRPLGRGLPRRPEPPRSGDRQDRE